MKAIKNIFKWLIISVWVVIAIFTTILLISYNDYSVSELGSKSIIIVDSDRLEPDYKKNDIIIATKVSENKYKEGDMAFFYIPNARDYVFINYDKIESIESVAHAEDTYKFSDVDTQYGNMIGRAEDAKVIHGWGLVLSIFESRWGFMFLIIFPTIFAFVYEIYAIVEEVKNAKNDDDDDDE